jgi:Na+-translocating ferredoxin:NAD+ oxidoreductase RnfG subunit
MTLRSTMAILALAAVCLLPVASLGTVYYSKDEAFELAFGAGATVESVPVFLTDEQLAEVEKLAKVKVDSKLFTFFIGRRGDRLVGYAAIDSHVVRTQQETLLVVLSPKGDLTRLEMLAFHEPPEYQSAPRWLEQLYGHPVNELQLNHNVDGVTGATLSSRAVLDGVRKVMAIYQLALKEEKS